MLTRRKKQNTVMTKLFGRWDLRGMRARFNRNLSIAFTAKQLALCWSCKTCKPATASQRWLRDIIDLTLVTLSRDEDDHNSSASLA